MNYCAWICCLIIASSLWAAIPAGLERASRQVIIKWRSMPVQLDASELLPDYASATESFRATLPVTERTDQGLERITTLTATTQEAAAQIAAGLRGDPRIEYAELRPERHTDEFYAKKPGGGDALDGVPNDPYYSQQWSLQAVEAEPAWNITRGDTAVVIAIIDVGVDFTHPDLAPQRWVNWAEYNGQPGVDDDGNGYVDDIYGYDFVDDDGDPSPNPRLGPQTHGTHVAGIAAAARNNGIGIAGLAPGCKIMAVRAGAGGSIGFGYDGIYYACRAGAKVINASWGGSDETGYEHDVLNYVFDHGCVVVAAAGNVPSSERGFPAAIEGVLSVAASQIGDRAADFTSFGPWVKVTAPGVFIVSTVIGDNGEHTYAYFQGTSMATPMASAVCALVASRFPNLNGRQIMDRVTGSSDPIEVQNPGLVGQLGFGRVNAWRALTDSVAGVRLVRVTYTETSPDQDNRIRGGETADLIITIADDIGVAGNVAAHAYTTSDSVSIVRPDCIFDNVVPGDTFVNRSPVVLQVVQGAERGPILPMAIDFFGVGGHLIGRATTTLYLDSTFVVADNGTQRLGFAENGSLGYFDYVRGINIGPGWHVSDHTNALFHGSFVLAADGAVSDNAYGNGQPDRFDWVAMPDSVAHAIPLARADYEARASFEDRNAPQELFARVEAAGLAWYSPGMSDALVLEYKVTNRSANAWNQAYAGLFLDIDLAASSTNVARYDPARGLAYVQQLRPTHPLVGIAPIGDTLGSLYVIDNRAQIDPPTWGDSTKWSLLTQGIHVVAQPMDLSFLMAVGPLSMAGHSSRTFAYAFVRGQTLDELRAAVDSARQRYVPRQIPPDAPPQSHKGVALPKLFPNPLAQGEPLKLLLPNADPANVKFYNVLGQMVAEVRGVRGGSQEITLGRDLLHGASGLLFYRIESASTRTAGKILILK